MSSGSSTEQGGQRPDSGFQPWHFYFLTSLAGATWAVIVSRQTHPAALLLISAAILAAGLVGAALHYALSALFGAGEISESAPAAGRTREFLEKEKALVLRSIKELEFDHAMRKVSDADFSEIGGRLRARAIEIMQTLDSPQPVVAGPAGQGRAARPAPPAPVEERGRCASCETMNDPDARFCKNCGARL
jgi:hypothetical protein